MFSRFVRLCASSEATRRARRRLKFCLALFPLANGDEHRIERLEPFPQCLIGRTARDVALIEAMLEATHASKAGEPRIMRRDV